MSTARRSANTKAKKNSLAVLSQQQAKKDTNLSATKAAVMVDKNSRTIMKLSQLLAIYNKPGASELDKKGLVAHRIERYKHRITRRLHKLAKFVDTPEHERPVERVTPQIPIPTTNAQSRKTALDNFRQKRELAAKAKAKAKNLTATSALIMEKMKAQKSQQLARNALLKAKGAAAQSRNKGGRASQPSKSDVLPNGHYTTTATTTTTTSDASDPDSSSLLPPPVALLTALPPLPPPSARCPAPPQIIYSSARNTCKHAPAPAPVHMPNPTPTPPSQSPSPSMSQPHPRPSPQHNALPETATGAPGSQTLPQSTEDEMEIDIEGATTTTTSISSSSIVECDTEDSSSMEVVPIP